MNNERQAPGGGQVVNVNVPITPVFEYRVIRTPSSRSAGESDPSWEAVASELNRLSMEGRADSLLQFDGAILVGEQIGFWIAAQPRIVPGAIPTSGFIEARRKR